MAKVQMQGRNTATQALVTWLADSSDWGGEQSPVPVTDVTLYTRGPESLAPATVTCSIDSPSAEASLSVLVPVTISFTVSEPSTVVVRRDAVVIDTVLVVGTGDCSWTPLPGESGTLTATATSTATGAVGVSSGVHVNVPNFATGYVAATPAMFRDTGGRMSLITTGPDQYYQKDAFSRALILLPTGAGTSFTLEAVFVPSAGTTADLQNNIGVRTTTDPFGSELTYNQTVASPPSPPSNTKQQVTFTVPVGTRAIELTENAYLTGFSAASYYVVPAPGEKRQIVFAGDSISVGNIASPVFKGFIHELRYLTRFDSVDIYGISGDSIFNRVTAGGASPPNGSLNAYAQDLVNRAQRGSFERAIFIEMVTNDYGLSYWTAANFQTQYAALVDRIHFLDPTIRVYCMIPLHRAAEGANGVGSTWLDFCTAITAVATPRSLCTLIDLRPFMSAAQSSSGGGDGLHPGTASHAAIAAGCAPLL